MYSIVYNKDDEAFLGQMLNFSIKVLNIVHAPKVFVFYHRFFKFICGFYIVS
jgi:hypothetical protein